MASTGINFENLTPPERTVNEIKQLLWLRTFGVDKIGGLTTVMPKVVHGEKLGLIGEYGPLGIKSTGCNPTYYNDLISAQEKEWVIRAWEVPEQMCYKDVEYTLVHDAMRTQTPIADLTGTEYMNRIVLPLLEKGLMEAVMRFVWFGDEDAASYEDGGILATSDVVKNFNVVDGFWKRFAVHAAANPDRLTTVDANAEDTWEKQREAAWTAGYATGIIERLKDDAPDLLKEQPDSFIMVTNAFKTALAHDIRTNNKGSELQWKSIFGGITETEFDGTRLIAVPYWDRMIKTHEYRTEGGGYHNLYRAVYTVQANLLVGTESSSQDGIPELDVTFDKIARMNYLYATDKIGTLLLQEDDLAQYAW